MKISLTKSSPVHRLIVNTAYALTCLCACPGNAARAETKVVVWGSWDEHIQDSWDFLRYSANDDHVTNAKSIFATEYAVLTGFNDGKFLEFTPDDGTGGYDARTRFSLANVKSAAGNYYHHIAAKQDGTVITWPVFGTTKGWIPAGLSNVKTVAAAEEFFAALKEDGSVVVWPSDQDALGQEPAPPAGLANVKAIAAGYELMVALKADGSVQAWGSGIVGEAAGNDPRTVPVEAHGGVVAIAAGGRHVLALKENGTVIAWGKYPDGSSDLPIAARANVKAISANEGTGMVLKEDGSVIVWPATNVVARNLPAGLAGVKSISAGYDFAAALVDTAFLVPELEVYDLRIDANDEENPIALVDDASSLSYGNTGVGSSKPLPIRIRNSGLGNLNNVSISVSGQNASDFVISTPPPATLRGGESDLVEVFFFPKAQGSRAATLHIKSSNPGDGEFVVSLRGTGINVPQIAVTSDGSRLENDDSDLSFGLVARGEDKVVTLVIVNEGNLKLEKISASIVGEDREEFAIVEAPVSSLKPGGRTTMEVLFAPESSGMKRGEIRIKSNDSDDNPFIVHLSGKRGRAPEIAIYNNKRLLASGNAGVSFGTVELGAFKTRNLAIENHGNAVLTDIKASLGSVAGKEFEIIESPAKFCSPGKSTLVKVRYAPSRIATSQAILRIRSSDKDEKTTEIRLSAAGGAK